MVYRAGKNLGFLEKVFRFLGFLKVFFRFLKVFLGFLGFLDFSVQRLSRDYWTVDNANLSRFTRSSYLLD